MHGSYCTHVTHTVTEKDMHLQDHEAHLWLEEDLRNSFAFFFFFFNHRDVRQSLPLHGVNRDTSVARLKTCHVYMHALAAHTASTLLVGNGRVPIPFGS